MADEPWTRQEQINYSVFHSKVAPPEWNEALEAIHKLAKVTNCPLGNSTIDHFNKLWESYTHASVSVD